MGYGSIGGMYGVLLYWWVVWGIALLVGCMVYCSIGGLYGVWLYWRDAWGMALLVCCMGYGSIGGLYGVYNVCSIAGCMANSFIGLLNGK